MVGRRYGRLFVISRHGVNKSSQATWNCVCDCGSELVVGGSELRRGNTRSCGCLHREVCKSKATTHGMSKTKTYNSWSGMISRCHREACPAYDKYGGLGVSVCDRWRHSFQNFLDDMGTCAKDMSLDRINPFGNYEPGNCRWASVKTQSYNKRGHVAIERLKSFQCECPVHAILSLPG